MYIYLGASFLFVFFYISNAQMFVNAEYIRACVHDCVCVHACVCVHVCMHTCMYACVCSTKKQTDTLD